MDKDPKDAEATYTLARTYLEMELEQKAIPFYVKAVELDPTQSKWSFELGLLYYNNDNYKNAVVYFNKAADQDFARTNDFDENLGFSYIYSGEFEKGEKLLDQIIDRYNTQTTPYHAAARLWVDAIIDPAETRFLISEGIAAANHNKDIPEYKTGLLQV